VNIAPYKDPDDAVPPDVAALLDVSADEHLAMSLDANLSTEVTEDVDQGALGHADGL
jgi:hypothetical protein